MAETVVENQVCEECGAELIDASGFCFNCDESVSEESVEADSAADDTSSKDDTSSESDRSSEDDTSAEDDIFSEDDISSESDTSVESEHSAEGDSSAEDDSSSEDDTADARLDAEMSEAWKDDDSILADEETIAGTDLDEAENRGLERQTELRTAASLRRRAKAFRRRPVRIVWEEPAQTSRLFTIVSIGLTLFAAAMLFLTALFEVIALG